MRDKKIGQRLRRARQNRGLTVDEIVGRMNRQKIPVTKRTIFNWESRGNVPAPALKPLADILGRNVAFFLS